MKNEDVLRIMEYIAPAMIEEAENYTAKKSRAWLAWGAVAACLCLVGAAGLYFTPQTSDEGVNAPLIEVPYGSPQVGIDAEDTSEEARRVLISRYDVGFESDMAVNNGHCELSGSLRAAIDEYGDRAMYRVIVEVFRDGTVINSGSDEVTAEEARLVKEAYVVAHETYMDVAGEPREYFTLHAEEDQLLHFPVNESYGYLISLYEEYLPTEN